MARLEMWPAAFCSASAIPTQLSGLNVLQGRLHPLPLLLASFRCLPFSCTQLPGCTQGWIPGSRLRAAQGGLPPPRKT